MMKRNWIASMLMVGATIGTGTAMAAPAPWSWSGTLAEWGASGGGTGQVTDGDGDVVFRLYDTTTLPDGIGGYVTLSETEINGVDYYDVGVTWDASTGYAGGYSGGSQLVFSLAVLAGSNEGIIAAAIDTAITGTGTAALARLYDLPSNNFIVNLSSFDGSHDPLLGYTALGTRTTVGMQYTFMPTTTGVFQDAHGSFVSSVPEPASMALVGVGLLGLWSTRRKPG